MSARKPLSDAEKLANLRARVDTLCIESEDTAQCYGMVASLDLRVALADPACGGPIHGDET